MTLLIVIERLNLVFGVYCVINSRSLPMRARVVDCHKNHEQQQHKEQNTMADLYNLLGELDEQQQQQQLDGQQLDDHLQEDFATPKADSQDDNPEAATGRQPHDNNDNDDDDHYRERLDLPPALAEAARFQKSKKTNTNSSSTPATVRMSMETQTTANSTSSTRHNDDDDNNEPLSLEGLMRDDNNNQDGGDSGLYSKLDHWWVQELHSPELLPYNDAIVDEMLHTLEMAEQQQQNNNATATGNTNNLDMNAMLSSIFQIDKERVQFVLSHLIKTRLQKIQQQAWFIAREQTDRLSQRELLFLQEYGLLLEGHLQQTVTNHFPQEAWKALDEPHMISPPVDWLEGYVFCHVKESCTIDNGTSSSQFSQDNDDDDEDEQQALQYHKAGDCIIVRYHKIRPLLEEGKVELLM